MSPDPNPIDAPGTEEADWRAWDGLRELPVLDLTAWREVVVIAAHPDDEVLGAGGLMALLADQGVRLRLVAVTDGEASHPHLPGHEIAARRNAESAAALKHLGDIETVRLGLPDSGVREEELRGLLPELVDGFDVCLAPWEKDVHRDHEAAGRAASACGLEVWQFPIWTWHWARPADPRLPWERAARVPLPPAVAARKQAAIDCFTSQFGSRSRSCHRASWPISLVLRRCSSVTLGPEYFEKVYAASEDPWGFTTRWYEQRKYALSLAMLPRRRYGDAFEPGCSIGVLTAMLASRCDRLLSCDVSPEAVRQARSRAPGARVEQRMMPDDWPDGAFDLIVFSEFLYYLGPRDLSRVLELAAGSLKPDGALLAVHWRHPVADYPQTGDDVHAALARTGLARLAEHRETDFVAEVYVNGSPVSVAAAEGLT